MNTNVILCSYIVHKKNKDYFYINKRIPFSFVYYKNK